jgi:mRNA-degrading endonuclease RelE of RelBE toxin-antitoxin system
MVDKLQKALNKLNDRERKEMKRILKALQSGDLNTVHYDIKKLAGRNDIYRIRKGKIRIIYRLDEQGEIYILAIERRSDTTYNF